MVPGEWGLYKDKGTSYMKRSLKPYALTTQKQIREIMSLELERYGQIEF